MPLYNNTYALHVAVETALAESNGAEVNRLADGLVKEMLEEAHYRNAMYLDQLARFMEKNGNAQHATELQFLIAGCGWQQFLSSVARVETDPSKALFGDAFELEDELFDEPPDLDTLEANYYDTYSRIIPGLDNTRGVAGLFLRNAIEFAARQPGISERLRSERPSTLPQEIVTQFSSLQPKFFEAALEAFGPTLNYQVDKIEVVLQNEAFPEELRERLTQILNDCASKNGVTPRL